MLKTQIFRTLCLAMISLCSYFVELWQEIGPFWHSIKTFLPKKNLFKRWKWEKLNLMLFSFFSPPEYLLNSYFNLWHFVNVCLVNVQLFTCLLLPEGFLLDLIGLSLFETFFFFFLFLDFFCQIENKKIHLLY